ncbi:MAG: TetR/AcrR family transcriptional regulator [Mariprofundaceae bacterium]
MNAQMNSRTRIINTAAELFYLQGFESVGLQKICTQANVSKSSFYHFFASKDEVAVAVVEAHWSGVQQGLAPLLASPQSPLQKIHAIFDNVFSQTESICNERGGVYGCPFGNLASELSNSNPELRQLVQRVFGYMTDIYIDLVEQAKAEGDLSAELDASQTANALVAFMQGINIMGKVFNDPARMRHNGEYTLGLILGVA